MSPPIQHLLRLLACLATASLADAQQGEGIVTIGTSASPPSPISGHRNVLGTSSAHTVFNDVLTLDFGGGGGCIVLLPGVYEFDAPVTITAPGVSIRGSRAAILRPRFPANSGLVGLFDVQAADFELADVRVEIPYAVGDMPSDQSAIRAAGPGASGVAVGGCIFQIDHGPDPVGDALFFAPYTFIRLGDGTDPLHSALIEKNSFLFSRSNGTGADAVAFRNQVVAVHATLASQVRVIGNTFRSVDLHPEIQYLPPYIFGLLEHAILFEDVRSGVINDNTGAFIGDNYHVNAKAVSIISLISTGAPSSIAVTGNYFEVCLADAMLFVGGPGQHTISGNSFSKGYGGIRMEGGEGGVVSGNGFHKIGPQDRTYIWSEAAIHVVDRSDVNITGNQFGIVTGTQIHASGESSDLQITSNHFHLEDCPIPGADPPEAGVCPKTVDRAIHVEASVAGCLIMNNFAINSKDGNRTWIAVLTLGNPSGNKEFHNDKIW